jgi:hypothetical protein
LLTFDRWENLAEAMDTMIKTTILSKNVTLQRHFGTPAITPTSSAASTTAVATQIRCYYAILRKSAHARSKLIIKDMMQRETERQEA